MELVLYKFDACPFCAKVQRFIQNNNLKIAMKDTMRDPGARDELREAGGKTQVPCLLIDGLPLYESQDIIHWLENNILSDRVKS